MGSAAEAYIQGGAAVVLILFASAAYVWLLRRLDAAEKRAEKKEAEKEALYIASLDLLKSYQARDAAALLAYQDRERRMAEERERERLAVKPA